MNTTPETPEKTANELPYRDAGLFPLYGFDDWDYPDPVPNGMRFARPTETVHMACSLLSMAAGYFTGGQGDKLRAALGTEVWRVGYTVARNRISHDFADTAHWRTLCVLGAPHLAADVAARATVRQIRRKMGPAISDGVHHIRSYVWPTPRQHAWRVATNDNPTMFYGASTHSRRVAADFCRFVPNWNNLPGITGLRELITVANKMGGYYTPSVHHLLRAHVYSPNPPITEDYYRAVSARLARPYVPRRQ